MEEINQENPNEQKQNQILLQLQNLHLEDSSLMITIPAENKILKTIMCQIQKREQSKQHLILQVKTKCQKISLKEFIELVPEIPQVQLKFSKVFSHSLFMNLKALFLFGVQFDNCEFMRFLDAPQLHTILLSQNKITNFKSLAKMSLPSLNIFHIQDNLAKKTFVERTKLPQISMSLALEFKNEGFVIEEDLRSLVKFEPQFCKSIIISSQHRVKSDLIRHKLKQRFVWQGIVVELKEKAWQ